MENMVTKILVTGSEGYIGTVLVSKLIQAGYDVVGLDTCYYGVFNHDAKFKLIKKDVRDIDKTDLKNINCVIHLAALSNDPMGDLNPKLTEEINYLATVSLAKKAKSQGVRRFLFSSSCSIYGIAKNGIVDEMSTVNPLTAYAQSKIFSEKELSRLADDKFCVGLLRNSTVYGYSPNFRNDLVVNNLVSNALLTKKIVVMSDGSPWRPLIDVRDLALIFIEFLKVNPKIINSQVFNIGFNENNFQVKDILMTIKKHLADCEVVYTGEHGKDSRSYKVSFNKFKNIFPNIMQKFTLEKSILDLIFQLQKITRINNSRISNLKELLDKKKINSKLYWR